MLPLGLADPTIKDFAYDRTGFQYSFRPNWLNKPFDNPKVRQALLYAFNQEEFLRATVGKSYFACGTPFSSETALEGLLTPDFKKAQELLKEAGYDGTPIVLLHSTDVASLSNLAPVAKSLMEKAGFRVDMQSMDWQTLVARRAKKGPPDAGGWHAFLTAAVAADAANPIFSGFLNSACEKATFGWPCDPDMESLRDQFARETDPSRTPTYLRGSSSSFVLRNLAESLGLKLWADLPLASLLRLPCPETLG